MAHDPSLSHLWLPVDEGAYFDGGRIVLDSNSHPIHAYRLEPSPNPKEQGEAPKLRIVWPRSFPGEQAWQADPSWLIDAPENIRETTRRVKISGTRLWHKINGRTPNRILGDQSDPDDAHALCSLIKELQVLSDDVRMSKDGRPQTLQTWLQRRKDGLIPFMEAVTTAENGTRLSFQSTKRSLGVNRSSNYETANFRFRGAMTRIDCQPICTFRTCLERPLMLNDILLRPGEGVYFPYPRSPSFWDFASAFSGHVSSNMESAAEGLYIQGRAMSENLAQHGRYQLDGSEGCEVIRTAMTLVLRDIEFMWSEVLKLQSRYSCESRMARENWLKERKVAACEIFTAFAKHIIPDSARTSMVKVFV